VNLQEMAVHGKAAQAKVLNRLSNGGRLNEVNDGRFELVQEQAASIYFANGLQEAVNWGARRVLPSRTMECAGFKRTASSYHLRTK
jgi:hypothetical protein